MKANRQYKDTLFTTLFNDKDAIRELYNALSGSHYGPDTPVTLNTLDNVLFGGRKNDISALIDKRLIVFTEQQSTINPNIPLRFLLYLADVYETLINHKVLYQSGLYCIPQVEFYMLYNGHKKMPDKQILKLSDMFLPIPGRRRKPAIDLIVQVNINAGHNPQLMAKSTHLNGYAIFVDKVREFAAEESRADLSKKVIQQRAIWRAIEYCIAEGYLPEFFGQHRKEVETMSILNISFEELMEIKEDEVRQARKEAKDATRKAREEALKARKDQQAQQLLIVENAIRAQLPEKLIERITGADVKTIRNVKAQLKKAGV